MAELNKEVQELTPKIDELNAKIADASKQQKNLKAYQVCLELLHLKSK